MIQHTTRYSLDGGNILYWVVVKGIGGSTLILIYWALSMLSDILTAKKNLITFKDIRDQIQWPN